MDAKNNLLTNFQPMPKRFMVWDTVNKEFVDSRYTTRQWNLCSAEESNNVLELQGDDRFILIQSTNLFDKDGEEIFEGSIVEDDQCDAGIISFDNSQWIIDWCNEKFVNYRFDRTDAGRFKCVGHILSNPELLEKN